MKPYLSEVTKPAQENHPIPDRVKPIVNRQLEGAINSDSSPGGYVEIAFRPAGPGERGSV